ncbi:PadR family transcriptional regulator [Lacticaseibacillus mingshuiensis]|uniref:PadR family transcriptional regulator n=1 Tax=Lacticaseibacillus mingshuiensis TaxID=2799574 RepID=A0ABW4CHI0_9LACO|nr:PadR family transcriptional regulator [Lacticaseibacillus mingshuiensis]
MEVSKDMVRGYLSAIVLNVLAQGESYGYQVTKDIAALSGGAYEINEATLYTVFKRLENAGLIASHWGDESQGGRRKYYQITKTGKIELTDERANWQLAAKTIDTLINGRL